MIQQVMVEKAICDACRERQMVFRCEACGADVCGEAVCLGNGKEFPVRNDKGDWLKTVFYCGECVGKAEVRQSELFVALKAVAAIKRLAAADAEEWAAQLAAARAAVMEKLA